MSFSTQCHLNIVKKTAFASTIYCFFAEKTIYRFSMTCYFYFYFLKHLNQFDCLVKWLIIIIENGLQVFCYCYFHFTKYLEPPFCEMLLYNHLWVRPYMVVRSMVFVHMLYNIVWRDSGSATTCEMAQESLRVTNVELSSMLRIVCQQIEGNRSFRSVDG